jgi:uncharacterized membrane protein
MDDAVYRAMAWLEASPLAEMLRGLGVWTYGIINLVHILGISVLFGAIIVLDLRLLGAWRSIPATSIARPTEPLAAIGFLLAGASGTMMLTFNTTEYHGNPFFYIKFPVIVLGLVNVALVSRLPAWRRARSGQVAEPADRTALAVAGGASLLIWLTVITCGRMIGYW